MTLTVTPARPNFVAEVSGVDRTILIGFAQSRTPWLTVMAADLTALGSVTLVVLISTIALCVLLLLKFFLYL